MWGPGKNASVAPYLPSPVGGPAYYCMYLPLSVVDYTIYTAMFLDGFLTFSFLP